MKLITPPDNWQNPIEIEEADSVLIAMIAERLDLRYTYDKKNNKAYLGLPIKDAPPTTEIDSGYKVVFRMPLPDKQTIKLVEGTLTLFKGKKEIVSIRASSGARGSQYKGNFWRIGFSPIPPSNMIQGAYLLHTKWLTVTSNKAGLGSRFYPISPDPIINKSNLRQKRTSVGYHFDENNATSPGSAGCIVALPKKGSEAGYNRFNDELAKTGLERIPMEVIY